MKLLTVKRSGDLLEHLLKIRNLSKADLEFDFSKLPDPFLYKDMEKACRIIVEAVKSGQKIFVFGDYDADGTPGAALLKLVFDKIGAKSQADIPSRKDGYGLKMTVVTDNDFDILVTVDNGISSIEEIKKAKELGKKVIILDHHLPKDELPPADAILDAHISGEKYPFKYLCGTGVAYKFAVGLARYFKELDEGFLKWLLDLVAISTVSDMVPLIGENRLLAHFGLIVLRKTKRPGLKALLETAAIKPSKINATTIGFMIAPRLNATGRMGSNTPALNLLITSDEKEALEIAGKIEVTNRNRQDAVEKSLKDAEKVLFEQNKVDDALYAICGEWQSGIIGLVAGRIAQRYFRPVIVGSIDGDKITGSCRSIQSYSIKAGLDVAGKHLVKFGGHNQAAGLTCLKGNWQSFVKAIKADARAKLTDADLEGYCLSDAILDTSEINIKTVKLISDLEPYGSGNPKPRFLIENAEILSKKTMGANNNHLKFQFAKDGKEFTAIKFNILEHDHIVRGERLHLYGTLEINHFNGNDFLRFILLETFPDCTKIEPITYGQAKEKLYLY